MANTSQKKPVNDLIKFWADKQEKKDLEPVSRSLRRPLFPNASLPTTPLNESFFQKAPFRDIPTNSPPSTPIKQSNNIHSLISDNGNSINDIQPVNNGSLPRNESPDEEDEEISCHTPTVKNVYVKIPRDLDINTRDVVLNKAGPLPPAKKVTDLVSKFEKVTSPTNSVTTSPRLTPIKQSYPTSPLALSPIKRNKPTLEPLSLPSTINSKTKRRQTVPEPLTISLKQISDEPDLISPISPIGNKKTSPSTEQQCVPEVQTQKKPVQQESLSNQSINNNNNNNNNNTPHIQKKVSESNPIPKPVILSIKQSDPEPIQPKQTSPASPTIQSDYLDFLTETLQSLQTTSFNSNLWDPENGDKLNKTVPEKKSHSQNKTFTNRKITKVTFDTTSNPNNNKNNTISNSNYEIPDLLPQPEPISPIRLTFSDFIISPNGSSTNLNSNDKQVGEKEKLDFLDMMSTKQSDVHKVVKPEVPKKDENYSSTKSMRHISGSIQFIESLRRYLQPNKYKNSDIVNVTTRKVASQ